MRRICQPVMPIYELSSLHGYWNIWKFQVIAFSYTCVISINKFTNKYPSHSSRTNSLWIKLMTSLNLSETLTITYLYNNNTISWTHTFRSMTSSSTGLGYLYMTSCRRPIKLMRESSTCVIRSNPYYVPSSFNMFDE